MPEVMARTDTTCWRYRKPSCAICWKTQLSLHRVKDKEEDRIFKPVEDISVISAELVTKMTYLDAVKEGKQFKKGFPSACTINRRVIEYGEKIRAFNTEKVKDAFVNVAFADGTKTHSQEKEKGKNGVNIVLGMRKGKKVLLMRV
jgi:hypothetical protein